ncbi:MAG TPA: hypothetical protein VFI08_03010, partial [Spirochaetia bacterium]|nr:hypothetical protein [Spirochaetia bacterium]
AKQVSVAVENVNEVTQSAASAAEEMSAATEQLASMSAELRKLTAQFKIEAGADGADAGAVVPASAGNGRHGRGSPALVAMAIGGPGQP